MDVNASLNWKQVVGAIIVLFLFGRFFTPIQMYVLTHPFIGAVLLVAITLGWWGYRRSKRKAAQAA